MRITFHGAAGEVTGSCARIEHEGGSFLVDCGMFQGGRDAERRNLQALDFDLEKIDFVVLTHAHLDHSGLLPRLVALGWRGRVHCTQATTDLLEVMLLDAGHIQEQEAEWATRRKRARRGGAVNTAPLYTVEQARASLARLRGRRYDEPFSPASGVEVTFREAGHILGSAIVEIDVDAGGHKQRLVFSGDLGMRGRPVLRDPARIARADVLVVESTYGNRAHRPLAETEEELVEILSDTLERRHGNVVIPAFAVGRTQEVIFVLADLVRRGRLPRLEIVVDSPMATRATAVTFEHDDLWDAPTRILRDWVSAHPDKVRVRFVADVEESIALNARKSGLVIVSASGMCEAGRIKHHLAHNLPRRECAVVICGFQAGGTLGRRLVDGVRQVTLFGERVPVHASVHTVGGLSAHADQPGLLDWLGGFEHAPRRTFVVHGEASAAQAFRDVIEARLGWRNVVVPQAGEAQVLDA
ncbi:MBL fold metallo-hydrolase RNA specificity domain-containing protein [Pseudazoarcus pumilus]|uniref:MBL fold hydrolase n=1 Tax=Pseudazoarcus pumilus TaxID=2067960 RepID=A0A2I6S807_9RHOO|nr:MBL fold metallo-hydrolase [Pseudazoarcus pumilus]AUN95351.1 MBL fold hydrolase [Pseudazoarcus pumilus]